MDAAQTPAPAGRYVIVVQGQLDPGWADWFDGLTMEALPGGRTQLTTCAGDPSALRGLLRRIFDLNLRLISITMIP